MLLFFSPYYKDGVVKSKAGALETNGSALQGLFQPPHSLIPTWQRGITVKMK